MNAAKKRYCPSCKEEISESDHKHFDGLCPKCLEEQLPEEDKIAAESI